MRPPVQGRALRARALLRRGAWGLLGGALAACAGGAAYLASALFIDVPSYATFAQAAPTSEARLLDRHGVALQRLRLDARRRQLDWVRLDAVSPALVRALVAAEDHRYYDHHGIDAAAMLAGLADTLRGRRRGASTISMQVASLVQAEQMRASTSAASHDAPRETPRDRRRTPLEKLRQARDALALERAWNKQQILEAYVNLLHFRDELVGVDAAARGLLGTGPGGLDEAQSAVLAALVRAPSARRVRVARRACGVLRQVGRADACVRAEFLATGLPARPLPIRVTGLDDAGHLARRLLRAPGVDVRSTLDAGLQRFAAETLRARLAELRDQNVEDGAVIVIDNASGDILAYVGSAAETSRAGEVDGVTARRQPGSALKPFLYAEAIDRRWLTAASLLQDTPLAIDTAGGLYAPQDYERDYKGPVSVRTALASSLNVPAVRALQLVGVDRFYQRLHTLGFDSLTLDARHYGVGLALGDGEVTLLELANGYRTLANGGVWSPVRMDCSQAAPVERRRVYSAAASFILADILADAAARALTFGFAGPLSPRTWAAVKTGTSKGMRDNWAIGFTSTYTVAAWVGNDSGAPMWDVSGVTGAAPIWQALVEYLHAARPSTGPRPPAGLVHGAVQFGGGFEAARSEWFLPGTALAQVDLPPVQNRPLIVEPADGTRVAPDPDIPYARQRIRVRANIAGDSERCLQMDGRALGPCGELDVLSALPEPGAHRITLNGIDGSVIAEAHIEIRAPRCLRCARRPGDG